MTDAVKVFFDTNVYFDKFVNSHTVSAETQNIFNKVKTGQYRLIISQSILMEIYHVMCLPIEKISKFNDAKDAMEKINNAFNNVKTKMLEFPNTEFPENEFIGINSMNLMNFVESVPGSNLIDFAGKKLPGSMDFIQLIVASNLNCEKFFTYDKGVIMLHSNQRKGNMKIIQPYKA